MSNDQQEAKFTISQMMRSWPVIIFIIGAIAQGSVALYQISELRKDFDSITYEVAANRASVSTIDGDLKAIRSDISFIKELLSEERNR